MTRRLRYLWLILALRPGDAAPAHKVSGSLERIMRHAVTVMRSDGVLLDAHLPDTGGLTADALAARYKLGDQVEVAYKPIRAVYDAETHLLRTLQVEKIGLLRAPSAEELERAIASPAWREPGNLLHVPAVPALPHSEVKGTDEERQALEKARATILQYLASLPNFVADETASRFTADRDPPVWKPLDVIVSEVTFKGNDETRDRIVQNGKPVPGGYEAIFGLKWNGAFGSRLKPIFDPQCPVTFEFEQRTAGKGLELLVYKFDSSADSCFSPTVTNAERFYPARKGKVFLDAATGNVSELDETSAEYPPEFDFTSYAKVVVWDYVKVGDTPHLLPVASDETVRFHNGRLVRVNVVYSGHRHFEASSTVVFK